MTNKQYMFGDRFDDFRTDEELINIMLSLSKGELFNEEICKNSECTTCRHCIREWLYKERRTKNEK